MKRPIPLQKLTLLLLFCSLQLAAFSQYWQQGVDYAIDVQLNDKEKSIEAFEKIVYTNNSPDTLRFIWFHLWPNAYKNDRTAFSDQLLENGHTKFYFTNSEERGYINRLDFKVDGTTAKTEDHPQHIDITKLLLPKALLPGQSVTITTPFHVKLPFNLSRGGYDGESFQLTQWYPKPAVYDRNGWHPMPYLDQGEFYSEFGNFEVTITVPKGYVVAATGEEMPLVDHIEDKVQAPGEPTESVRYKQGLVHDFAWFASKAFVVDRDTCELPGGRTVQIFSYHLSSKTWMHSTQFAKDAIRFYSTEVGVYPYNVAKVVEGPKSFGGGMEYPTITIISPMSSEKDLDITIAHELGHNWFYGILGSNEREHPWMDEGLNSFYEQKYAEMKYGRQARLLDILYLTKVKRKTDQPIETPSTKFSESNYFLTAYGATAAGMRSLEKRLGTEDLRARMHAYFEAWKFKHPQPEDFRKIFNVDDYDAYLNKPSHLLKNDFQFVSPLKKGSIKNYLHDPVKDVLLISPAIGINGYDKLMIGGLITNYKLPPNSFQYLLIPMYGTGSKKFTELSRMSYSFTSNGWIRKTDVFLNSSRFSMNEFKDTAGRKLLMQFRKIVPGIRMTMREKEPRSTVRKMVQWKTFFVNEQGLRITPDTIITGTDTAAILRYSLPKENRYLNQLQFVYENSRGLYPFNIQLQLEQSTDFIRPALTANYFFNYREGGLQVRLFAGKFIYLGEKTISKQFRNDRYFLNMTGANGYEDYTYSDFFFGRNKFEGLASQQIMIRDGGLKVRTDLLAEKVGKTDDWLAAINFSSTVPQKMNPLALMPVKIPLKVFLDIGTYAEAWNRKADVDRFLFDAGFQISIFQDALNIYIPVLYNKVYGDYFKSTIPDHRFLKKISFSFSFFVKDLQRLNREVEF